MEISRIMSRLLVMKYMEIAGFCFKGFVHR